MPSPATIADPRPTLMGEANWGETPEAPLRTQVIVADAQNLVCAGIRLLLEATQQITVVGEAASGEEAVALARRLSPDVALIDAGLPGLDSIDATREMSADLGVAVMLLAATESDERILPALRAGATGLLLKDTDPAEFVSAVAVLARGEALLSPSVTRCLLAELASRPEPARPSPDPLDELTAREREAVTLVAQGFGNDEIAERLAVTVATAKTHVCRAMVKLNARNRAGLVVLAYETGLVRPRIQDATPVHVGRLARSHAPNATGSARRMHHDHPRSNTGART